MVTRIAIGLTTVVYLILWMFALAGARSLIAVLAIPLVLVVLVAGGNWLSQFMGLPSRSVHFNEPDADDDQ